MILEWWDLYGMDLVHMVAGRGIGMTPLFAPKSISQLTAIRSTARHGLSDVFKPPS